MRPFRASREHGSEVDQPERAQAALTHANGYRLTGMTGETTAEVITRTTPADRPQNTALCGKNGVQRPLNTNTGFYAPVRI